MTKKCKKCKKFLDFSSFYPCIISKDGLTYLCKKCTQSESKRIRTEKRDGTYISKARKPRLTENDRLKRKLEAIRYQKKYRKNHFEYLKLKKKEYLNKIKKEGISHYGGKCSCCGERTFEFLTLEHLNGRNKNEKRFTGKKSWLVAKSEGYPNIYTVLCFNCNCAKGIYGICPHQNKH